MYIHRLWLLHSNASRLNQKLLRLVANFQWPLLAAFRLAGDYCICSVLIYTVPVLARLSPSATYKTITRRKWKLLRSLFSPCMCECLCFVTCALCLLPILEALPDMYYMYMGCQRKGCGLGASRKIVCPKLVDEPT